MLQSAGITAQQLQGFQVFQTGAEEFTVVDPSDLNHVNASESAVTVQPLAPERPEPEENIQPPIPKV